eukprot:jgi/Ulvmu1/1634/UM113_0011.1
MLFSDVLTTYSADSCNGTPFCVYVHDGSLQKGKVGTPLGDVPGSCFSSTNQLCAMCSFIVTIACDETNDVCIVEATNDGSSCGDGLFCNGAEICTAGVCAAADTDPCDDYSAVTACSQPACDETNDRCFVDVINEGGSCGDGLFCNGAEICTSGVCAAADTDPCDDFSPVTACSRPACDETNDACIVEAINEGGSCSDGLFCNGDEICTAGVCAAADTDPCDDPSSITACSQPACDETNIACIVEAINEGGSCSDGLFCNGDEICTAGVCAAADTDPCDDFSPVTACSRPACDETNDECIMEPINEGGSCADDLFCNGDEICTAGVCAAADTDPCDDFSPVTACSRPACDETNIACIVETINEGGSCADDMFCNGAEICTVGVCAAADTEPCDDFSPVTACSRPACDETNDECIVEAINNGGICTDGVFCNGPEEMILEDSVCDDNDPCTEYDACRAGGDCVGKELCPGDCQTCDLTGVTPSCTTVRIHHCV